MSSAWYRTWTRTLGCKEVCRLCDVFLYLTIPKNLSELHCLKLMIMASKRKAAAMKGEKVPCQDLRQYLYGVDTYRQASMLRKGREVHKIYVDVHKGLSFMDDRFSLTEFGRMVLESGSVRAGRARNVRQIVVARETLYCSGTTGCMRACGGQGQCLPGETHSSFFLLVQLWLILLPQLWSLLYKQTNEKSVLEKIRIIWSSSCNLCL